MLIPYEDFCILISVVSFYMHLFRKEHALAITKINIK